MNNNDNTLRVTNENDTINTKRLPREPIDLLLLLLARPQARRSLSRLPRPRRDDTEDPIGCLEACAWDCVCAGAGTFANGFEAPTKQATQWLYWPCAATGGRETRS